MKRLLLIILLALYVTLSSNFVFAEDYFPLKEGLKKEYTVRFDFSHPRDGKDGSLEVGVKSMGETTINNNKVNAFVYDGGHTRYFLINDEGILEYATQSSRDPSPKLKNDPIYYIKYPLEIGSTWKTREQINHLKQKPWLEFDCSIVSLSETVIVPAIKFEKCLHVKKVANKTIIEKTFEADMYWNISAEKHIWYAPDIGIIKGVANYSINLSNALYAGSKKPVPRSDWMDKSYLNRTVNIIQLLKSYTNK